MRGLDLLVRWKSVLDKKKCCEIVPFNVVWAKNVNSFGYFCFPACWKIEGIRCPKVTLMFIPLLQILYKRLLFRCIHYCSLTVATSTSVPALQDTSAGTTSVSTRTTSAASTSLVARCTAVLLHHHCAMRISCKYCRVLGSTRYFSTPMRPCTGRRVTL